MNLTRKTQPSLYQVEQMTIREYVVEHKAWSEETFGKGEHTEGLLKHITKKVEEVRKCPSDAMEWIDIIILAFDGVLRVGFTAEQVVSALIEKQNINRSRAYPKITDPSQPTEHLQQDYSEECYDCHHKMSNHLVDGGCQYLWEGNEKCMCRGFVHSREEVTKSNDEPE
jgi:hypothetical protein